MNDKEFINEQVERLRRELKNFPDDFMKKCTIRKETFPGKRLLLGEEFFGAYEIITADGAQVYSAKSFLEAKFIVYSGRTNPKILEIPVEENDLREIVLKYEQYIDGVIRTIDDAYKTKFPGSKSSMQAVAEIFKLLGVVRF